MAAAKCPICGKAPETAYRPFCSKHCADVDLGRWFGERYTIPVSVPDETTSEESPDISED